MLTGQGGTGRPPRSPLQHGEITQSTWSNGTIVSGLCSAPLNDAAIVSLVTLLPVQHNWGPRIDLTSTGNEVLRGSGDTCIKK